MINEQIKALLADYIREHGTPPPILDKDVNNEEEIRIPLEAEFEIYLQA